MTVEPASPPTSAISDLLDDPTVVRVIVADAPSGGPLPAFSPVLQIGEEGHLLHLEFAEASDTAKSLLNSLWFNRPVAILLARPDGSGARILGRVERSIIAGPLFQRLYAEVQARHGEVGLAAIWEIRPTEIEVVDRTRWVFDESATRPFFTHLDRLAIA